MTFANERANGRSCTFWRTTTAHYYGLGTDEIEKESGVYEQWHETYPRDTTPLDNLALSYALVGLPEKSIRFASEAMRLDPKDPYAYTHLANSYVDINRFDEAKSVAEQGAAAQVDSVGIHRALLRVALIRGDQAGIEREISGGDRNSQRASDRGHQSGQSALGRVQLSRDTDQVAITSANRQGRPGFVWVIKSFEAVGDAAYGYTDRARQEATEVLRSSGDRDTQELAALALAQIGDAATAQKVGDELSRYFPQSTFVHAVYLPMVRALAELQRTRPAEAVAALEPARKYEFGVGPGTPAAFWPVHIRDLVFLGRHEGAKAAAEFQKILDHRGAIGLALSSRALEPGSRLRSAK